MVPSALTIIGALASFWLLSVAMKSLPVGTAYAVWVGIGAVGTAIPAVFLFNEAEQRLQLGVLLILSRAIALKFAYAAGGGCCGTAAGGPALRAAR